MTKDEALKLALEALEEAADAIDSWGSYASGYFQVKHDLEGDISKAKSAITAIREALAQPEQEPVACIGTNGELMWLNKPKVIYSKPQPLYTTPPQRTWQGLTEDEINEVLGGDIRDEPSGELEFVRAIEAKLKEKNT